MFIAKGHTWKSQFLLSVDWEWAEEKTSHKICISQAMPDKFDKMKVKSELSSHTEV